VETSGASSTSVVCVVDGNADSTSATFISSQRTHIHTRSWRIVVCFGGLLHLRAHSKLIEDPLTAGSIAVAIARNPRLDVIIVDLSIQHSLDARLVPHLRICTLLSRFDKLG
jgi:hypothetical protein